MRIWARILGVSHPAVSPEGVKTSHGVYMVFGAGWTVSGGTEWLLETVERLLVLGLTHWWGEKSIWAGAVRCSRSGLLGPSRAVVLAGQFPAPILHPSVGSLCSFWSRRCDPGHHICVHVVFYSLWWLIWAEPIIAWKFIQGKGTEKSASRPWCGLISTLWPDPAASLPRCTTDGLAQLDSGKQETAGAYLGSQWCHPPLMLGGELLVWGKRDGEKAGWGPTQQVTAAFFLTFQLSSLCFPLYSLSCKSMHWMFRFHWIWFRSAMKLFSSSVGRCFLLSVLTLLRDTGL